MLSCERAKFQVLEAEAQLVAAQGTPPAHRAIFMSVALDALRAAERAVRSAQHKLEAELYFPKRGRARLRREARGQPG